MLPVPTMIHNSLTRLLMILQKSQKMLPVPTVAVLTVAEGADSTEEESEQSDKTADDSTKVTDDAAGANIDPQQNADDSTTVAEGAPGADSTVEESEQSDKTADDSTKVTEDAPSAADYSVDETADDSKNKTDDDKAPTETTEEHSGQNFVAQDKTQDNMQTAELAPAVRSDTQENKRLEFDSGKQLEPSSVWTVPVVLPSCLLESFQHFLLPSLLLKVLPVCLLESSQHLLLPG